VEERVATIACISILVSKQLLRRDEVVVRATDTSLGHGWIIRIEGVHTAHIET